MNRDLWNKISFSSINPIEYPCPRCKVATLFKINGVHNICPGQEELQEYNYPYGISYIFNALLQCRNNACLNVISISGLSLRDISIGKELPNGEMVEDRMVEYYPKYFFPNLEIIHVSSQVSKNVKEQLNLSFSNFFNDLSSCGNRIRNSIELILDDLKAPSRFIKNNKLKDFNNLHQRIVHYQKKGNKRISRLLLAVKIIGNEGSHIGEITRDDILDSYEFLEKNLDYVYDKNDKTINTRATTIVTQNSPRSKHAK